MGNRRTRDFRLSLAIGADALIAVSGGEGRVATAPLALPAQGDASPALSEALAVVADRLGLKGATVAVDVALLPPLADVRLIELPPIGLGEAELVVQRNAARYFVGGGPAMTVGVARTVEPDARRASLFAPFGSRTRARRTAAGGDATEPANGEVAPHAATGGAVPFPEIGEAAPRARPVLAAAAPMTLVESIHRAVRGAGWRLNRIVPALAAWVDAAHAAAGAGGAAARVGGDPAGAQPRAVIVEAGGHVYAIRMDNGAPTAIRRLPAAEAGEIAGAAGRPGLAVVIAGGPASAALTAALAAAGWTARTWSHEAGPGEPAGAGRAPSAADTEPGAAPRLLAAESELGCASRTISSPGAGPRPHADGTKSGETRRTTSADAAAPPSAVASEPSAAPRTAPPAAVAAARYAGLATPELVPVSVRLERQTRARRRALRIGAAAVALLVAAAGLELWSVHRALGRVREARAAIRANVAPLIAIQDSIARVTERIALIEAIGASAPAWTRALTDIALHLPFESHLTGLVASGDTLEIEAAGARAGEALQALRGAPSLADVRLIGMVDRELDDGATAVERFRISARLAPDPSARRVAKVTNADAESGDL